MPQHVSSTCAHRQEGKIVLYSLWYHHTYRCDDTRDCIVQFWPPDDHHISCYHHTYHTYRCDVTRDCIVQFWPPDDHHISWYHHTYRCDDIGGVMIPETA